MNEIKANYQLTTNHYRTAVYYAAVLRHRLMLIIAIAVGLTALACWISSALGFMPPFMLPAYLFIGYAIWLLFICGSLEHGILKYSKNPDCILYKDMSVTFAKGNMKVDTPYNKKSFTVSLNKLFYAFELNNIFIIYVDGAQSILLPHSALSASERAEVRSLLTNALGDRFSTRFGYNNMLPRRSPLRK